jgi:hypothetical protein
MRRRLLYGEKDKPDEIGMEPSMVERLQVKPSQYSSKHRDREVKKQRLRHLQKFLGAYMNKFDSAEAKTNFNLDFTEFDLCDQEHQYKLEQIERESHKQLFTQRSATSSQRYDSKLGAKQFKELVQQRKQQKSWRSSNSSLLKRQVQL